jgi:hypothetical protein
MIDFSKELKGYKFSKGLKDDLLWLKEQLTDAGIFPHDPATCTKIKEELDERPREEIANLIAKYSVPAVSKSEPPAQKQGGFQPAIKRGIKPSGWLITVYGPPGVGKSTFAAECAPGPVVFIDVELGLERIECDSMPCTSWAEFERLVEWFNGQDYYKTLATDTADVLEKMLWKHICRVNKWKSIETPGFGRGYAEAMETWADMLGRMKAQASKGKQYIFIAHSQVKTVLSPDGDSYDRHNIDLNTKSAGIFFSQMDAVLFAHQDLFIKQNASKDKIAAAVGERMLACSDFGAAQVKNRFGLVGKVKMDSSFFSLLK